MKGNVQHDLEGVVRKKLKIKGDKSEVIRAEEFFRNIIHCEN